MVANNVSRALPMGLLGALATIVALRHLPALVAGLAIAVVIIGTAIGAATASRMFTRPIDAAVIGSLSVVAWIVAAGLVANVMSGGIDAKNTTLLFAVFPWALFFLRLRHRAGIGLLVVSSWRTGRTRRAAACGVVTMAIISAALVVNIQAEHNWLRTSGVVMDVPRAQTSTVEIVNRNASPANFRLVSTSGARSLTSNITLGAHQRWTSTVDIPKTGNIRLDLYNANAAPASAPLRTLVLTASSLLNTSEGTTP